MTPFGEKSGGNVAREIGPVNQVPRGEAGRGSGKRHLVRAAAVVAIMTLIGRICGLFRDIVSAKQFGTSWQWDAFLYAFMLPNLFRRVVGEGGLTSAFIPVYNEIHAQKSPAEAFRFANITISFLSVALLAFIVLVETLLHFLLKAGFQSQTVMLTLELSRILFPYLWFLSLYALGMGILNSHRHFLAPAAGPAILDLVWIAAVIWVPSWVGQDYLGRIRWLSYAVLFAGFLHVAVEWPPLCRIGFKFRWIWDMGYEGLKKTWRLLLPVVLSFAVVQINITVDMTLGMMIGPGANSSLWYGNRLMQFPLGVFALAMGTALLPMLAQQIARGEKEASRKTLSFALRSVFFIIIPSSVGLVVMREPIVRLLFERGEFDAVSTARSAAVLLGYTIGLFAFAGQKILNSGYYAAHDSRTPMRTSVIALISNIAFNLILMIPLKEAGLALGTSLSGILQLGQLIYFYPKRVGEFPFREIGASFLRILAASIAMGVLCYFSWELLKIWIPGASTTRQLLQVFGSIAAATLGYLGLCFVCRVPEIQEAFAWFKKKRKPESHPEEAENLVDGAA
ncbi:MAG TPA: murein biosynthesis integral membrane protein MurJ [Candidatus Omnitrophota bacterium]|nr:murein biosynthesis integral membrane protein MurJ [Candidatus Omnitrophota bacterium]HRY85526.1 murein biosynthesis integral membrane protein MurJ [Candidatus Omnitrophota bacterium]